MMITSKRINNLKKLAKRKGDSELLDELLTNSNTYGFYIRIGGYIPSKVLKKLKFLVEEVNASLIMGWNTKNYRKIVLALYEDQNIEI